MKNKKEVIVRFNSTDPDIEDRFVAISIPENKIDDFERDFDMGVKYAKAPLLDDPNEYDKYFYKMIEVREQNGKIDAFIAYMEILGYVADYICFWDYEFEL